MFTTRFLALAAAVSLTGCTLELDETATNEVAALQFSDQPLSQDAEVVALAGSQDDAGLLSDVAKEADVSGADLLGALFGGTETTAPPVSGHQFGDPVAYGEIEAVCDAPRALGTKVATVGGFTIYDSNPGSTQLRAHYVTGFNDRCARQFSAALMMTGDVGTHEVLRYLPSNRVGFNATDNAYEAVKASYCRVRHGSPCGSRLDALAGKTTFITAYDRFGSSPRWVEVLLHDGKMKAIDFKTN